MNPRVRYELVQLEGLVNFDNQPPSRNIQSGEIPDDNLRQEIERIKQTFIHEVFTFGDERHLERYIQYHQQAIIRLMDNIVASVQAEMSNNPSSSDFFQKYYKGLEELLSFIERHFLKYFDQDAKAPEGYVTIARADATANVKKILKGLSKIGADPRLIDLLLYAVRRIIEGKSHLDVTYRKVMYAKEIQKELFTFLQNHKQNGNPDEDLRMILYYLNYNSIKTFTYHTHLITTLLNESETRAEKIEKLSLFLKKINQAQVKPGISYSQQAPTLKSQLNGYITEEMDYLERLQQLSNAQSSRLNDPLQDSFKLKLEISVAQLAFLIKVFVETKILQNNNLTELLRFLSRIVITKKSENISFDSFRAKFYNVEVGTKQSVRTLLISMVNYIDRD